LNSRHEIFEGPIRAFTKSALAKVPDIFAVRAALIYTPTDRLPARWVGTGTMRARLPLVPPNHIDFRHVSSHRSPRLWVDLLQRSTRKIRWTPMNPAHVAIRVHFAERQGLNDFTIKAVLDSLKRRTTGRHDGRLLYYFGAIEDDGPRYISTDVAVLADAALGNEFTEVLVTRSSASDLERLTLRHRVGRWRNASLRSWIGALPHSERVVEKGTSTP
jgi:hypothetical protein